MAKTYEGLKTAANIIKNEIEAEKNTATRVGTMLVDCIDKVEDVDNTVNTRIGNVNNALSGKIAGVETSIESVNKKIKTLEPIDVTALMTVGGTLAETAVSGGFNSLVVHPLYFKGPFYSTVHVCISNRVYYLVAHHIGYTTDGKMFRLQRVAECTAENGVMTCNKLTELEE